jgi:tetratricopeptide (TPR) repeat protein
VPPQSVVAQFTILQADLTVAPPNVWVTNSTALHLIAAFLGQQLLVAGQQPLAPPFLLCGSGSSARVLWSSTALPGVKPFLPLVPQGAALQCFPCPAGSAAADADARAGLPCVLCDAGYEAPLQGQAQCAQCDPGYAAAAPGTAICVACPAGAAAPSSGSTSCTPCADGTFTAAPGTPACAPCPSGQVSGPGAASFATAHMYALGALSPQLTDAVAHRGCAIPPAPPAPPPAPAPKTPTGLTTAQGVTTALSFVLFTSSLAAYGTRLHAKHRVLLRLASPEALHAMTEEGGHGGGPHDPGDGGAMAAPVSKTDAMLLGAASHLLAAVSKAGHGPVERASCAMSLARATQSVAQLLREEPRHPDGNAVAGALHFVKGEHGRAYSRLTFAAAASSGAHRKALAAAGAGITHTSDGDVTAAVEELEAAVRVEPRLAVCWHALGLARAGAGDLAGALVALNTATECDQHYFKAHFNAATVLAAMGKFPACVERLQEHALRLRPRDGNALAALGEALLRCGDAQQALPHLQGAVNALVQPRARGAAQLSLARAHLHLGCLRSAAGAYLSALDASPSSADAVHGLALVEMCRGRAAEAEMLLGEALRREPAHFGATHDLALLWLAAGRLDDALATYWRLEARLKAAAGAPSWGRGVVRDKGLEAQALHRLAVPLRSLGLLPALGGAEAALRTAAAAASRTGAPGPAAPIVAPPPEAPQHRRLVLLADTVGAHPLLAAAALRGVTVVPYDGARCTGHDILSAAQRAVASFGHMGRCVTSIAVVAPPVRPPGRGGGGHPRAAATCPGVLTLSQDPSCASVDLSSLAAFPDAAALLDGLRTLIGTYTPPSRAVPAPHGRAVVRPDAPQLHIHCVSGGADALQARYTASAATSGDGTEAEAHGRPPPRSVDVIANDDLFDAAAHAHGSLFRPPGAEPHAASLYFSPDGLARWAARPEALRPPPPASARLSTPATAQPTEPDLQPAKRKAGVDDEAPRVDTQRRRVSQSEMGAVMRLNDLYDDSASPEWEAAGGGEDSAPAERRGGPRLSMVAVDSRADTWVAVQLLIDLPWSRFGARAVQSYFLRELAAEMEVSPARLRVTAYDRPSGLVTVTIMPPPRGSGQPTSQAAAQVLCDMIQARTLTVDAQFGDPVFVRAFTQGEEDTGTDGAPMPRTSSLGAASAMVAALPSPSMGRPKPQRLLLLSRRVRDWRSLQAAALPDVLVVDFSHEHGTLDEVLHAVAGALGSAFTLPAGDGFGQQSQVALPRGVLRSIGLLSTHKPGSVGFVRGHRWSVAHVTHQPALRSALTSLSTCLAPDADGLHLLHWPAPQGMGPLDTALISRLQELCCCAVDGGHRLGAAYITPDALRVWRDAYPDVRDAFTPSTRTARRGAVAAANTAQSAEEAALRLAAVRAQQDGSLASARHAWGAAQGAVVPRLPLDVLSRVSDVKDNRLNAPRLPLRAVQLPPQGEDDITRVWAGDEGIQRARAREETGLWAAPTRPMADR